ncbi:hypothetical protein JTE90_007805 [Oedothorax gibbosus]|uniref:ATP synthase mitochondrial F1 complex assembly factor 2 n=1 Tax=Oedothorax gibbosus TaxID=931172 RepID=A0AAV6VH32_9ARAC|nr:hypothetical protein JTE90_007805 [Oedothorax gibbosus]
MSFATHSVIKCFLQRTISFKVFSRTYPAPIKRFYKNVHVSESDGKFEISLDKRKLKTPLGKLLQLPNEALAVAVATEWDTQQDIIQQHNMHISALCNTALDNPCKQTTDSLVDETLQYLSSDTLCFRAHEQPTFLEIQREKWDPLLQWFVNRYNVNVEVSQDISTNPVPDETIAEIRKQLLSYNYWCMLGINFTTENLKSLIIALALVNHVIDVEQAVSLSRLETAFQIQTWGVVEWAHHVDEAQIKARVAAGVLFTYLNEGSSDFVDKKLLKKVPVFG